MTDPKGRGKTCEPDVKAIVERKLPIIEADKITLRYSQEYVDQLNARHSALILQLTEGRDLDKVVLDEGIEIINELESSNKLLSERVAVLERIISNLNPEEAIDDSLLRDIHLRLVIHGEKYPDRMVSVLHRNVVFYTIAAAVDDYIGGKKS